SNVYEARDQRNVKQADIDKAKNENRFHEGKEHSHLDDSKDSRTIANKLAREEKHQGEEEEESEETKAFKQDPTLPVKLHGNEPSKVSDYTELQAEEEAELKTKGKGINDGK
ncbi:hypothetical protein B0O99DRAFT_513752, partial [Bisporella sp. PMI_857]